MNGLGLFLITKKRRIDKDILKAKWLYSIIMANMSEIQTKLHKLYIRSRDTTARNE